MRQINVITGILLVMLAGSASAKEATILIPAQEVIARTGGRGQYYVISFSVPREVIGTRLDAVTMVFAVDTASFTLADSLVAPVVGAFPLTQAYNGSALTDASTSTAAAFEDTVPSALPVVIGENRVMRMDITGIVRRWIEEPTSNRGLVIGSLTGPNVGTITLKDRIAGANAAVRITFFYQNRFEDGASVGR